jgi:hypothetical protein
VQVANGIPPYSWGFAGLWVPINLDTSTGVFSGISTVTGTFTGYLAVSDASSYIARQTVTLTVKPCP